LSSNADGSPNFDVRLLTSPPDQILRPTLREKIDLLFRQEADIALFFFSGHGTENNLGGYLVTPDAKSYDEGVNLTEVLTFANSSPARERVVMLDSCMSGAFGEVPSVGSNAANLNEGVSVLTASRAGEVSVETGGRGMFTELVCGALEGGAADVLGAITVAAIYAYVEEALGPWDQRPLFKAHLSKLVSLRTAQPSVRVETLRQFPIWFSSADDEFPLDPSYEDTQVAAADPEHVAVFKQLQQCRDAKLVEAVDAEYMYFAAVNGTGCRLTPLGRHYWRLAKAGRI
jgi:caspase domain-containing protein